MYCKGYKKIKAKCHYPTSAHGFTIYTATHNDSDTRYTNNYPYNQEIRIGSVATTTYQTFDIPEGIECLIICRTTATNGTACFGWYYLLAS